MPLMNQSYNPLASLLMQAQGGMPAGPAAAPQQGLPDLAALSQEGAKLARRRKLAEALAGMAQQDPGQMVSGHYVTPGLLGQVARLGSAIGGVAASRGLDRKEADLAGRTNAGRAAILAAMQSGDPAALQAGMLDEQLAPFAVAERKAAQARQLAQDKIGWEKDAKGKWVRVKSGPGGGILTQNTVTGELQEDSRPPSAGVHVNLPPMEKAFDIAFGKGEGTRLSEGLESRSGKIEGVYALTEARELLDQGIYSGFAANAKTLGAKIAGAAVGGQVDNGKATRTEQLIAHLGDVVIPRLKDFGGSDTVEELKYLQDVVGGRVTLEGETIRKMIDSGERKLRRRVKEIDAGARAAKERNTIPTVEDEALQEVPPEQPAAPAPPAKIAVNPRTGERLGLVDGKWIPLR